MILANKLETIDLCLRVLRAATEVSLSEEEVARVRKIALAYLDAELGISAPADPLGA
jgi:hypothetical protein